MNARRYMYFLVLSCMPSLHGCLEHLDVKADVQVDAEKPEAVEAGEGNLPKEVL